MDYKKMTETRQSCRAFDPVRTPDRAVLTQVLEAARLAPSACNSQPYHFYVAVDGTARAVGAATQSLGMNKFAGDCPAFIVVAEQPYNRSDAVGAKLKDQDYRAHRPSCVPARLPRPRIGAFHLHPGLVRRENAAGAAEHKRPCASYHRHRLCPRGRCAAHQKTQIPGRTCHLAVTAPSVKKRRIRTVKLCIASAPCKV